MDKNSLLLFSLTLLLPEIGSAIPDWAKTSQPKSNASTVINVCSGRGPSLDQARAESIASCKASASNQLSKTARIKSLSVETEKDSAFHQEVAEKFKVTGLICKILNEAIEDRDGFFEVWNQCSFDLKVAKVEEANDLERPAIAFQANQRSIAIVSIPPCSDVIIRGTKPRTVDCSTHPTTIIVEAGDQEVIIRADGHAPKTLKLAAINGNVANVQLERMR